NGHTVGVMSREDFSRQHDAVRDSVPRAQQTAERMCLLAYHRHVVAVGEVENVGPRQRRRHADLAFTPSRYSNALNTRWIPGPMSSTYAHIIGGVGTTTETAISAPRIESTRSTTKQITAAAEPRGDLPGAMSSCRFTNEFGSSPAMNPSPATAPSAPSPPIESGQRPATASGFENERAAVRPANASAAAGTMTTNPRTVLLSPNTRRPRNRRPPSSGIISRRDSAVRNHAECAN